jgi:hypothetical protein
MSEPAQPNDHGPERARRKKKKKKKSSRASARGTTPSTRRKSGGASNIPTKKECLKALAQLPGLVVTGMLKTAQANALRGIYQTILQAHQKDEADGAAGAIADSDLREAIRRDPQLAALLEPLLTDQQIAMLMQEADDGHDDG